MAKNTFEPVRVGVVGVGRYGRLHARAVADIAEARLVALVDHDPAVLAEVGSRLPDAPCWDDLSEALSRSDAEAWIVATSTSSHVDVTKLLLAAGAKVLLEKPIAEQLAEAQRLRPLVAADSGNLMMGHTMLFNNEFKRLLAEANGHGPIRYISSVRHRRSQQAQWYPGEIPLLMLMTHDLYMTLVLLGGAEPVTFHARNACNRDEICDLSLAELIWDDGAVASISTSYLMSPATGSTGFDRLEVFGQNGFSRLAMSPPSVLVRDDRASWPMPSELNAYLPGYGDMMLDQLRCFCRVVRGEETVPFGARHEDAMTVLRWQTKLLENTSIR